MQSRAVLIYLANRLYKPFARKPWLNGLPRACTFCLTSNLRSSRLGRGCRFGGACSWVCQKSSFDGSRPVMDTPTVIGTESEERLVVPDQELVFAPRSTYDMRDSWPIRGVIYTCIVASWVFHVYYACKHVVSNGNASGLLYCFL